MIRDDNEDLQREIIILKKTVERLAGSEEQFRLLYEKSPLGMAFADADGFITDCNDKFTEIAGAPREKLIGFNLKAGVSEERVKSAVDSAFSGTLASFEGDYVTATGSRVLVMRTIYSPLFTSSGSLRGIMLITEDITERRRAEEALKETEEKFRLFLEYCPVHVFFKDKDIRAIHLSRNFEKMLGRPVHEMLGKTMDELFPSVLAKSMVEDDLRILREGKPFEVEEEFNGRIYYTLKFPIFIDGEPRFLAGFTTDITERKLAERKLVDALAEAQRFREALDNVSAYIYMKDPQSRYVYANQPTLKLFGCSAEELVGSDDTRFFPPDTVKRLREIDLRVLEGEKTAEEVDVADAVAGRRVYWEIKTPIYAEPDRKTIWGLLGISTDITEQKRAEEELRRQIERYDLVVAGVRDGIWDWDVPNKRVFFSSRWKAMRGFSEEEVNDSEEEWSSGVHPEDAPRVFASIQAHFEGKTPWFSEEYRVRCKDGTWMWVHDRGIALRDASGRVIRMSGSESDITVRKHLEEEREKLIAELKEALAKVKTLSGLLPICSHCKKVRDDKGYWRQIEIYIRDRSEAEFSHGICPDCLKKFYPEHYDKVIGQDGDQ